MSEYLLHVHTSGPYLFLPYFPSFSLRRDVVVMTTTCDHHKERGLSCPFWDSFPVWFCTCQIYCVHFSILEPAILQPLSHITMTWLWHILNRHVRIEQASKE